MDADIRMVSAVANDFRAFLGEHGEIRRIAFNGKKAEQLFGRMVSDADVADSIVRVGLPSTSPAYAAMPFSGKLAAWRTVLSEEL
jgi:TDG/mug DNA glycosylase family protein